ncbi:TRAP transporter substrate-binding protein [Glaciecola sp. MH2013]|uniref:TRAP transporter substrate-binding protein n=1 Tax=Glaciecola sp. MH2013 TaxID=2785524 RepID=UPI00189E6D7F|nr:TRAP transporter substrate-binding protein [Glaciecola sp. MH2013]
MMVSSILLIVALSACSGESDTKTLRIAHGLDVNHPVHQAMVYMRERLQVYSGGSMDLLVYPSGQLGSERENLELLQIGSLSMTKVSASSLEAFVPEMKMFSVPYLFSSPEHLWNVLQGDVGMELLEAGKPYYFLGLGYYDAGSRSFYTTEKPVYQPDDLQGMKIRVMNSQSAVNMVNTMGGSATPVSWGELYTALQQGVVDGAENNPPSFYLSKHYEVAKYYLLDEHTSIPDVLVFSTNVWKELTSEQQSWVRQAAADSVTKQRALWKASTELALQEVKKAGVEVVEADKRLFANKTAVLREQYEGTKIGALIQRVLAQDTGLSSDDQNSQGDAQ